MTFADIAIAYQLVCSGCPVAFVAPHFGVSDLVLSSAISRCLERGKAGVSTSKRKTKLDYPLATMETVMKLRMDDVPYKVIARKLRTDPERLRKEFNRYDRREIK